MTIFDTFIDDVAIEPTYSDIRKLYRRQLGATTATSRHTSYSYHTIAICTVRFCILHSLLWGSTVGYPIENSDSLASCASVTIHNVQSRLHQNMPVQDQKIKNFLGEEFPRKGREGEGRAPLPTSNPFSAFATPLPLRCLRPYISGVSHFGH